MFHPHHAQSVFFLRSIYLSSLLSEDNNNNIQSRNHLHDVARPTDFVAHRYTWIQYPQMTLKGHVLAVILFAMILINLGSKGFFQFKRPLNLN